MSTRADRHSAAGKMTFVAYAAKDFIEGTLTLAPLEELAYRRLCDLIYITGNEAHDDPELASFTKTGDAWPAVRDALILKKKIKIVGGRVTNKRCSDEIAKAKARKKGQKTRAKAAANARWEVERKRRKKKEIHASRMQQAMPEDMLGDALTPERLNESTPIVPASGDAHFLRLKSVFPERDKPNPWAKAKPIWDRLLAKGEDPERIIVGANAYRRAVENGGEIGTKFVAQITTFLNQRRWEDYANVQEFAPVEPNAKRHWPHADRSPPWACSPGERAGHWLGTSSSGWIRAG
jgi:uncharacterized protein YdaU (DUF1376 family)